MKRSKRKTSGAGVLWAHGYGRASMERMMRIHRKIEDGEYPNCTKMSAEFEVSVRTLKRDIEFMNDRLKMDTPCPAADTFCPTIKGAMNNTLNDSVQTDAAAVPVTQPAPLPQSQPQPQPNPQLPTIPRPDRPRRKLRRNGRVARLPRLHRDMVNRMLWNGVPYKNIVAALDRAGYAVTERNLSNWARGGYLEWSSQQHLVLQNRLDQDHLLDHLRRDDPSELPEVGLQAAATRISQILLHKTATAEDLEANLPSLSHLVDVLCRLSHQIGLLQKQRDDSRRSLGRHLDPARIKDFDEIKLLELERYYSDPPEDSGLPKPAQRPAVPPLPSSAELADQDLDAEAEESAERHANLLTLLGAFGRSTEHSATPTTAQPPAGSLPETAP